MPATDTMQDRIEEKLRSLVLASPEVDKLQVLYRGEPGVLPIRLYPFGVVFLDTVREATGEEGYGESTGMRHFLYTGYVAFEVVYRDVDGLLPDLNREADVPSYLEAKELCAAAWEAVFAWGGPTGNLEASPVVSSDGKEQTVELRTDLQRNGLTNRGLDNVNNRSSFEFHIYTRRLDW